MVNLDIMPTSVSARTSRQEWTTGGTATTEPVTLMVIDHSIRGIMEVLVTVPMVERLVELLRVLSLPLRLVRFREVLKVQQASCIR